MLVESRHVRVGLLAVEAVLERGPRVGVALALLRGAGERSNGGEVLVKHGAGLDAVGVDFWRANDFVEAEEEVCGQVRVVCGSETRQTGNERDEEKLS